MSTKELASQFSIALEEGILRRWYPLVLDRECGGYFTNVTHDWMLPVEQEKMIVTQARHVWTLAKVAEFCGNGYGYDEMAMHGYYFLKNQMWDSEFGGFYQIRNRLGGMSDVRGWRDEKRAYGCAFGIYALAALARRTGDNEVMDFAQEAFQWVEEHSFDPTETGYFEFLTRQGKPFDWSSSYKTIAADANELGFKDQNSSIHLLEAYTELYNVWKSPFLKMQLAKLLILIRDAMVTREGYLGLFFHPGWKKVSFRNSPEEEREKNFGVDHVSFGHDYETAFLMLEASHALGMRNDLRTLSVAKKMLDHALQYGFDESVGGFYEAGYYLQGEENCTIVDDTKNWWAQAEGLNALLLFSKIFPEEKKYYEYFLRQWKYVKTYILDARNGDWFEGGVDKQPEFQIGPKSHMWKCTYHTCRALMNCFDLLSEVNSGNESRRKEIIELAHAWKSIAQSPAFLGEQHYESINAL